MRMQAENDPRADPVFCCALGAWRFLPTGGDDRPMHPPPLAITLFGPLRVTVRGEPLPRVRTRSVEWVLALLALRHGRAVSRAWLAGTLWPESEESRGLQNLREDLVRLRKALGP